MAGATTEQILRLFIRHHPVLAVFLSALFIRLVAGVVVYIVFPDNWLALDDDTYAMLAEQMASGSTNTWSPYLFWLYDRTATFLVPLTALYWLFGPHEFLGPALVALVGAGTAAMTTALALGKMGHRWALGAGLVVAVLPSQVGWSVTTLKDPWVWLLASGLAVAIAAAYQRPLSSRWLPWTCVAASLFLLSHLRLHSAIVAGWALVIVSVVLAFTQRAVLSLVVAVALVIGIPWAGGGGPGGLDEVVSRAGNLDEIRLANATGAGSSIVDDSYREADEQLKSGPDVPRGEGGLASDLRHLPRGISVMLLEPYPWAENRTAQIAFAKLDTLLWYPLLGLAVVGVTRIRRHPELLLFPLLYGGGMVLVYALAEGNLGTAFRHRGEFVWVVALFAAFGAARLWGRRMASESASDAEQAA